MRQLVNLSNHITDNNLINSKAECLQDFLDHYHLDGIEMMFCGPLDENIHRKKWVYGVHLRFWPWWLDFWRGDQDELLKQFGSEEHIKDCYGGLTRDAWLDVYRDNIRTAQQAGAKYLVFHVSHVRMAELFSWQFKASDREIIEAAVEVINELAATILPDTVLLFENLWWPGLTLRDPELTARLLDGVTHRNVGIMLDTGHLMNTNPALQSQEQGIDYILETIAQLGSYRQYIKGIHLHYSLSGQYIVRSQRSPARQQAHSMTEIMEHVLKIDEHQPFSVPAVRDLIDYIQPDYLVHEFMKKSPADWHEKVSRQCRALMAGRQG